MNSFIKSYGFAFVIFIAALTAFLFPQYFLNLGSFKFTKLIIPLLQLIMFGVGATMTTQDFIVVFKSPQKVIIGLVCQFTIMPLLGYSLSVLFNLPNEIAAGLILVGCSPSGLASNVMALMARANVTLSVTITSCATLLSPFFTPILMKLLAHQYVEINTLNMVFDILKLVIVPILLGLVFNKYFSTLSLKFKKILPLMSMLGIALIIMVITAAGKSALAQVGMVLVLAVFLHNVFGYILGYTIAWFLKLEKADCRTVAIEVGLQNAGLASGLALQMGKIATIGLAAALFGPIMNITGSLLAGFWGRKKS